MNTVSIFREKPTSRPGQKKKKTGRLATADRAESVHCMHNNTGGVSNILQIWMARCFAEEIRIVFPLGMHTVVLTVIT